MKNFKKAEKSQVPCLLRQQRFTPLLVRSRDGGRDPESQLLGKLPGSLLSFQKPVPHSLGRVHFRTWPPGFSPLVEGGQVAVVPSTAAPWKEEGRPLHKLFATMSRLIFQIG